MYAINENATSITTLDNLGTVPLYNPVIPSFFKIEKKQSAAFLYFLDSNPYKFVLTTSKGVLPNYFIDTKKMNEYLSYLKQ